MFTPSVVLPCVCLHRVYTWLCVHSILCTLYRLYTPPCVHSPPCKFHCVYVSIVCIFPPCLCTGYMFPLCVSLAVCMSPPCIRFTVCTLHRTHVSPCVCLHRVYALPCVRSIVCKTLYRVYPLMGWFGSHVNPLTVCNTPSGVRLAVCNTRCVKFIRKLSVHLVWSNKEKVGKRISERNQILKH